MYYSCAFQAGLAGDPPDPYVKLYLLPDPMKVTKRKTKIVKSTFHPTFNEIVSAFYIHLIITKCLRKIKVAICNDQADSLFYVWADARFGDLQT